MIRPTLFSGQGLTRTKNRVSGFSDISRLAIHLYSEPQFLHPT